MGAKCPGILNCTLLLWGGGASLMDLGMIPNVRKIEKFCLGCGAKEGYFLKISLL